MATDPTVDPLERPARSVIGDDDGGTLDLSYGNGFDAGPAHPIAAATRTAKFSTFSDFSLCNVAFVPWAGMEFNLSYLSYTCFHRADLTGARFMNNCTMYGCDFSYAWMNDVTFEFVFATGSDFTGANMDGAHCGPTGLGTIAEGIVCNFDYCDFTDAILTNCDFTGAIFTRSCFIGADLTGANLDQATFVHATYDSTTIWPAGFNVARVTGAVSAYADYSGQTLNGIDFTGGSDPTAGIFLGHANFRGATLNNCALSVCMWADFTDAQLMQGTITSLAYLGEGVQIMPHAILRNTTLDLALNYGHSFSGNLAFADLTDATMGLYADDITSFYNDGPTWVGWGPQYVNFSHAKLVGLKTFRMQGFFNECNLSCADLSNAKLSTGLPGIDETGGYGDLGPEAAAFSNYSYATLDNVVGGWYTSCLIANASFKGAVLTHAAFNAASIAATDFTGAAATTACFDGTLDALLNIDDSGSQLPAFASVRPGNVSVFPAGVDVTAMPAMLEGRIERTGPFDLVWTANSDVSGQAVQMTFYAANILLSLSECLNMRLLGDEDPGPDADVTTYSNLVGMNWDGQSFDQFSSYTSNYGLPIPPPIYGPLDVGTPTTRTATRNRTRTVADASDTGTVMTF